MTQATRARDANHYVTTYGLTATHSEVLAASQVVPPCKTLDLGCGRGRNTLYLSGLGFDVTAVDANSNSIATLQGILASEGIDNVQTAIYDINNASITDRYDFIVSTVVLMFLQAERIPDIIANMQAATNAGGYNLIVCAMDTEKYPCDRFSFKFKEGELKDYYQGWTLHKYNENVGELHATGADGKRLQFQFATMLAQKP